MVLETLLRKCQYHVTTANQAITALNLLRENKGKFDLVISDVDMPHMDGFMLLEYVGLEMDLLVIMLSSYGDRELVMKGITHGACDYLLKPVRIEELKNIWQHVVRRKKVYYKEQKTSDKAHHESGEPNKKRKDQNNEEDEECEEKGQHSSTQKKPCVVWTPDLHRKFVAAVNKPGLDKAVPKKIMELMDDEKLTRENVASHLQANSLSLKYRSYLKKYYRSYPAASVPSRLNTPTGLGLCFQKSVLYCNASSSTLDFSSKLPNFGRCNDNWPASVQSPGFFHEEAPSSDLGDNMPTSTAHLVNPHEVSCLSSVVNTLPDVKTYLHCQTHPVSHHALQNMNHNPILGRNILYDEFSDQSNRTFFPGDSLVVPHKVNNLFCQKHEDEVFNSARESDLVDPFARQLDNATLMGMDLKLENFWYNSASSLEDLVKIMKGIFIYFCYLLFLYCYMFLFHTSL
ncbi:hypothetical protein Pfo_010905 [Paulownia fortunei]|nr:hypothetical protein Pfo_010905 [Paulownia fortunei]